MTTSRRQFLRSTAIFAGAVAFGNIPALGKTALAKAAAVDPTTAETIIGLVGQRDELIVGSGQTPSIIDNCAAYSENIDLIRTKYLEPVGYNAKLLSPTEAQAMQSELGTAHSSFTATHSKLTREVAQVDQALKPHQTDLDKMLEPTRYNEAVLDNMTSATSTEQRMQITDQCVETPFDSFDPSVVDDLKDFTEGRPQTLVKSQSDQLQHSVTEYKELRAEAQQAIESEKPEDWKEQRKAELLKYAKNLVEFLASKKQIKITSALERGPGPDAWNINSYGKKSDEGKLDSDTVKQTFAELNHTLSRAYSDEMGGSAKNFTIKYDSPKERGYGVYETQRLQINDPEFALREILRQAAANNVKIRNDASGITEKYQR